MDAGKLAAVVVSALVVGGSVAMATAAAHNHGAGEFTLAGDFTRFSEDRDRTSRWSEGDKINFAFDLRERHRAAGDGTGECRATRVRAGELEAADCRVTFRLGEGRLDMSGEVSRSDLDTHRAATLGVTGGTHHYAGSSGKADFSFSSRDRHFFRDGHRHRHGSALGDLVGGLLFPGHGPGGADFAAVVEFG